MKARILTVARCKTHRRFVWRIGLVSLLLLCITPVPSPAGQAITLTYQSWMFAESGGDEYRREIAEFEKQNPSIKVEVTAVPLPSYPAKIAAQAHAGELPDIIGVDGYNLQGWITQDYLRDMTPFIEKAGGKQYLADFYTTLIEAASQKGKVYALPRFTGGYLLTYNAEMFKEAGLDPNNPPATWDELLAALRKLTKKDASGKTIQWGIGLHAMNIPSNISRFVNWMYANDADVLTPDGKAGLLDRPKALETIKFWSSLYTKEGVAAPGAIQNGPAEVRSLFAQKKIATLLGPLWGVNMIIGENPTITNSVSVAPFPKTQPTYPSNFQAIFDAVSANSKHPEEAFKLLAFMTERQSQLSLYKLGRFGPTRSSVFNMPDVANDPYAKVMARVNQHLKSQPTIPKWEQVCHVIGDALQQSLNATKTPETAFKDANVQINQVLK